MIGFIIGLFVGIVLGVVGLSVVALISISRDK